MLYRIFRVIIRFVIFVLNGHMVVLDKEKVPKTPYILVAPHRTWWEPVLFAVAGSPMEFSFMAKAELFHNPIIRWILRNAHAFPVDRAHPGPSAVKTPINNLRKNNLSVIIFPTGTRYSNDIKGGAALIARLAGVQLVPVVYQGPLTFMNLLKRQKMIIGFGDPITVSRKGRLDDAAIAGIDAEMRAAWHAIDQRINPDFVYVPDTKKAELEHEEGKL
ncbi:lysophospholipid acyltransferase family protein [Schleiferilactobacillus harbinensis]|jgi:1-acyl-sn-glycerol-3-phosphate acyltransferase|uniref:1-acyl-sn-glycerol-3-phosphate acyltransferase n=1 Tax=Schleiferilactobacillus harbinensis TaxID=304207 RepID=A0A510TRI4_9LACO|nr:1-acyl-sn-glycerol-3-phosphate acyltransferase [Schleiferilactobacillus harbinensis]MCI1687779.1 1-acyl-sn-glycerol-3-phosphate acyltransferase [Schleiferilactobacillus harbinensis]MCI1782274.1 1-acyl-sn-glycerol-3-phosphate acyltransferase [Schleiferilactobacillus harbinensis]MCI1850141.1 1-acyl-sn-glycerol-3-phosphate acyltransferase [Schleiferilactobacillus harbinensis]MCT2907277.1 1-acyl-sn-glycerol-3-phosphate acyltransferase [Schleiferilactobacillus harbinensis]QFR23770.1 1-acyl-sn-gl